MNKTTPLRSSIGEFITDGAHQLDRWVAHYSDLCSIKNIVSPSALDAAECLPTMEELDRANLGGAQRGHQQLGLWQGPWQRRDPSDLIKHCILCM